VELREVGILMNFKRLRGACKNEARIKRQRNV
jgi:hypothetical protein